MQRLALFIAAVVFAVAAAISFLTSSLLVNYVENSTSRKVASALDEGGFDWVSVRTDGLLVRVSGPAPKEAARFNALASINEVVNADRVIDSIKVADPDDLRPPRFSLELLRNDDGISLIGLIPDKTGRAGILETLAEISADTRVTDMLETADYPQPDGWTEALEFALTSLRSLPRSKISVTPQKVTITAITESQDEKTAIERTLLTLRPGNIALDMKISAPRPVISPFSLRLIVDEAGARFDACSADNEQNREQILSAARAAGLQSEASCSIGLGAPTPRWAEAAVKSIQALVELGGGSVTFSDADITLVANTKIKQIDFDRIVYNLEQTLPDIFSVRAILPPKPVLDGQKSKVEPPEFLATKSPEGLLQMRGRVRDESTQVSVNNFAKAMFGGGNVDDTTRTDPAMPDGWPVRILAGLQSLGLLNNGILIISPEMLEIRGVSSRPEVSTEVTQILSTRLGDASMFMINITYEEALNRQLLLPTPQECVDRINKILKTNQIVFAPSSTKLDSEGFAIVEKIAEAIVDCDEVPMEIGGHTDSQGRDSMNLTLSQARAEAVLDGLLSNEVLTTSLTAKGYGESQPIADNKTEEGRRANRRIEFRLIGAEVAQPEQSTEKTPPAPKDPHQEN